MAGPLRLRPADEDLWGAGAVLTALSDRGVDGLSPEARAAVTPEPVDGVFLPRPVDPAPEPSARQEPRRDVRRGSC